MQAEQIERLVRIANAFANEFMVADEDNTTNS